MTSLARLPNSHHLLRHWFKLCQDVIQKVSNVLPSFQFGFQEVQALDAKLELGLYLKKNQSIRWCIPPCTKNKLSAQDTLELLQKADAAGVGFRNPIPDMSVQPELWTIGWQNGQWGQLYGGEAPSRRRKNENDLSHEWLPFILPHDWLADFLLQPGAWDEGMLEEGTHLAKEFQNGWCWHRVCRILSSTLRAWGVQFNLAPNVKHGQKEAWACWEDWRGFEGGSPVSSCGSPSEREAWFRRRSVVWSFYEEAAEWT